MALLEVKGLYKEFAKERIKFAAVDGVDLTVEEGECLGLVGESGCGKSTIANLIARLLQEDRGEIHLCGKEITKRSERKWARGNLQMIFQNPTDSFDPRYSLLNSVKQGLRHVQKCSREELDHRAKEAISFVGLKESYYKRAIHKLSGGECQRAAIARAIIGDPKLIICDEATSALDVSVQAQIVALLKKLKKEKQISYLFITHDLTLAHSMCDRVAVMYRGTIVEYGDTHTIIQNPVHPYTKMLLSCVLPAKRDPNFTLMDYEELRNFVPEGCKFYDYCPKACDSCRDASPKLEEKKGREVACFLEK